MYECARECVRSVRSAHHVLCVAFSMGVSVFVAGKSVTPVNVWKVCSSFAMINVFS